MVEIFWAEPVTCSQSRDFGQGPFQTFHPGWWHQLQGSEQRFYVLMPLVGTKQCLVSWAKPGARSLPQALGSVTPKLTHWIRFNQLYWNNKNCAQHTGVWMRVLSGRQGLGMALWCSACWSLGGDLRGGARTPCSAVHGGCSGFILGNWTLSLSFARSFCLFVWHAHTFILFDCAFWGILSSALRADSCAQG